jgi:hypothetical protein
MSTDHDRYGARFWITLATGWIVIVYGVVQLFANKDRTAGALRIAAWVASGHAVHDLLVVPVALASGTVLAAVLAPHLRAPVRAGLLGSAFVLAVAYPALRGFGRKPGNPSLLPLDYVSSVASALAIVWTSVLVWSLVTSLHRPGGASTPARAARGVRRAPGTRRDTPGSADANVN